MRWRAPATHPHPPPTVFRTSQGSRRAVSCKARGWECDRSNVRDRVVVGSRCWWWLLVVVVGCGCWLWLWMLALAVAVGCWLHPWPPAYCLGRGCVGSRDRRTPWMAYASLQGRTCSVSREPTHPRPPKPHPVPPRFPLPASRFPLPASRFPLPASRFTAPGFWATPNPKGQPGTYVRRVARTPTPPAQPRRTQHPMLHAFRFGILGKPKPHKACTCCRSHRHTAVTKTSFHSSVAGETGPYPATE